MASLLALAPLPAQHAQATAKPTTPAAESVRLELGQLDPKLALLLLESQLHGLGEITIDGSALQIQADAQTLKSIRETLAKYRLGQMDPAGLLPAPSKSIPLLDGKRTRSLGELFEEYCNLAGVLGVMDASTQDLASSTEPHILGVSELVPDSASALLEMSLFQEGFLLDTVPSENGMTLRLLSQNSPVQPMLVDFNRLGLYAGHHALYIQTVLHLPNTDVRSMSNVCRQLIHNPQSQRILPLGSSSSVLIQGPSPWVRQFAQVLLLSEQVRQKQADQIREAHSPASEVIRLKHAEPEQVLAHLNQFYGTVDAQGHARITASIDSRLHAIVLRCNKADQAEILEFIARLDVE